MSHNESVDDVDDGSGGTHALSVLCMSCGRSQNITPEVACCQYCGDGTHLPAILAQQLMVRITAHELRCLTFWAGAWADHVDELTRDASACSVPEHDHLAYPLAQCVSTIVDRLAAQYPAVPLTAEADAVNDMLSDLRRQAGDHDA